MAVYHSPQESQAEDRTSLQPVTGEKEQNTNRYTTQEVWLLPSPSGMPRGGTEEGLGSSLSYLSLRSEPGWQSILPPRDLSEMMDPQSGLRGNRQTLWKPCFSV